MGRFLYRAEPNAEDGRDVFAKNPEDTIIDAVEHIMGGNKSSRYLSATDSIMIAGEKYANGMPRNGTLKTKTKKPVIIVDADALPDGFIEAYDLKQLSEGRLKRTGKEYTDQITAHGRGIADREVLILKHIPENAYKVIPPLLVDVLEYMENQKQRCLNRRKDVDERESNCNYQIKRLTTAIQEKEALIEDIKRKRMAPDHKQKMINSTKKEIEDQKVEMEKYRKELASIPNDRQKSEKELKTITESLEKMQKLIMEGKGKKLEETIISELKLNDLEKKFVELYYKGDKSVVGVGEVFGKCMEGQSEVDGVDVAVAVRHGLIEKIIKSRTMQEEYMMEKLPGNGFFYPVIPPGGFASSSERKRGEEKRFRRVSGLWYDNIFMKIKAGMRIDLDYDIIEQNNDTMDVTLKYTRYSTSDRDDTLEPKYNQSDRVRINLRKLQGVGDKPKKKTSGKKVLGEAMNETERKVKMGDINTEGKKLKGQTEKSTKKESHTTDDDI